MLDKKADFDAIIIGARTGDILRAQIDSSQRPDTGIEDARRIAELEREVRELRRTNEILEATNAHFLREIDPELPIPAADARKTSDAISAGIAAASWRTPPGPIRWTQAQQETRRTPQVMVEFRVLGPLEAVVDGQLVDLGAPKQRALLALLVSRVGQPVTMDVMQEELWGGYPPPSAITSLHAYVANLRRVLEPNRAPRTSAMVLRTRGRGYLLDSRVVEVDAHRFGEHATTGWQAWHRDDPQQALSEFEAGLVLWRGQPYVEVADALYVVPEVARLEELRLSVIEGRCAALLAVGAHEVAVAELEAFIRAHPLREYGCELLSLALYRTGRQADALAVLRNNQKQLAEKLGIDPRPALRQLEHQILNQAPALEKATVSIRGPLSALSSPTARMIGKLLPRHERVEEPLDQPWPVPEEEPGLRHSALAVT